MAEFLDLPILCRRILITCFLRCSGPKMSVRLRTIRSCLLGLLFHDTHLYFQTVEQLPQRSASAPRLWGVITKLLLLDVTGLHSDEAFARIFSEFSIGFPPRLHQYLSWIEVVVPECP